MFYLMINQIFWDENKSTSMLLANKIIIENGCVIITVKKELIKELNKLLTEYYNTRKIN